LNLFKKLRDMKILLIDDDEWIRDSLLLFFQGEGCSLVGLANAEEAIEILKKQSYDIIISDYRLPGMDGLEFFKSTRESHPHTLKILITAYGSDELASMASSLGIDDLILKPLTTNAIEKSLSHLVERYDRQKIGIPGGKGE